MFPPILFFPLLARVSVLRPGHHERCVSFRLTGHEPDAVYDFAVVANDELAVLVLENRPRHAVNEEPAADRSFVSLGFTLLRCQPRRGS